MLRILIMLTATGLGMSSVCGAADMTVQPLKRVDDASTAGYSMLVRKDQSILARVATGGSAVDEQVWWLVFNNPEACASRPCTVKDIYRSDTRADLIPVDQEQRHASATGDICLPAGKGDRSLMPRFGLPASGLVNASEAEVQLVVAAAANEFESWVRRMGSDFYADCKGSGCNPVMIAVHTPRS